MRRGLFEARIICCIFFGLNALGPGIICCIFFGLNALGPGIICICLNLAFLGGNGE